MKKALIILSICLVLVVLVIGAVWLYFGDELESDRAYEQRQAENEQQIRERLIATCHLKGQFIYHLDYSNDGKYIALRASGIQIRDGNDLSLVRQWEHGGVGPLAFHPSGKMLAHTQSEEGKSSRVDIRSVPDGNLIKTLYVDTDDQDWDGPTGHDKMGMSVDRISFSPDGKYLLTHTDGEWKLMIWDTGTWGLKYALKKDGHRSKIYWASFAPDSQSVYISIAYPFAGDGRETQPEIFIDEGKIIQYSLLSGKKIRELKDGSILENFRFYFSQDGKKILFEGYKKMNDKGDGRAQKGLWILYKPMELAWMPNIPSGGRVIDFFNPYHAVGKDDGYFVIFDVEKQKFFYGVDLHAKIGGLKFSSDGKKIAVGSGGSCYLFRVE